MRTILTKQKEFWEITAGDEASFDQVIKKDIHLLDHSNLPDKDASFEILTDETKEFVQNFDEEYPSAGFNRELFLSLCKKYGVEFSDEIKEPMIKDENGMHPITKEDLIRMFTFN